MVELSKQFPMTPVTAASRRRPIDAQELKVRNEFPRHTQVVNRVYATLGGSIVGVFLVSLTHEQLHLHEVVSMIDFGTLMLLFSMMINVNFLAQTGFFQWY